MKIAVIGDYIEDEYLYTTPKNNPEHISPCYNIIKQERKDGGAGNVVKNLFALGLKPDFFHPKPVSKKTRIICDGKYVCRIDNDIKITDKNWLPNIDLNFYDYIVVSDYNKGAINKTLARKIIKSNAIVIVDCKPNHAPWFKDAYLMKPNAKEHKEMNYKNYAQYTLVTNGEKGMVLYKKNLVRPKFSFCGHKVKCIDVTGAGDTVLATLVWALSKKKSIIEACILANKAGSIAVQHMGCYAVKAKELL